MNKSKILALASLFLLTIPLKAQNARSIGMPNIYNGQDSQEVIDKTPGATFDIAPDADMHIRGEVDKSEPLSPYYEKSRCIPDGRTILRPTPEYYVGIGAAQVLDTYLSPYTYQGNTMNFFYAKQRHISHGWLRLFDGKEFQVMSDLSFGNLWRDAIATTTHEYALSFTRQWNLLWHINLPLHFHAYAGPGLNAHVGVIYNTRNSNNPASAKASFMATGTFKLVSPAFVKKHHYLDFSYQLIMPFLGAAFSPAYGQLYYEAFSLNNKDHNTIFAHPGNTLASQHLILGHLRHRKWAIHFGMKMDFYDTRYNNLLFSRKYYNFLIGWQHYLNLPL